ncbi:MAG: hypothetical protein IJV04_01960, partial [Lachnospiraceae bacterium]|nr:hypothetical protein [Lachnospiraceae bacterium]
MKRGIKKVFCMALALAVGFSAVAVPIQSEAASPTRSNNIHDEDPDGNWSSPICSYLVKDSDSGYNRVEYVGNRTLVVENYDSDLNSLESKKTITLPLPLFGGFFAGSKYNFVVVGHSNPKYSHSRE